MPYALLATFASMLLLLACGGGPAAPPRANEPPPPPQWTSPEVERSRPSYRPLSDEITAEEAAGLERPPDEPSDDDGADDGGDRD